MIKGINFFLLLFISINLFANKNDDFKKKEIKFIKELYLSERYFDCIAEIGKIQAAERNPGLEYFKYINYYLAEQYSTIIFNYGVDISWDGIYYHNSLLLISGSYLKKGMYHESYERLKVIKYDDLPKEQVFTMFLRKIEPLILLGDSANIKDEIYKSELLISDDLNFAKLREELELYNKSGLKSQTGSAMMSAIIPGSGQIYSGYYIDGVISFLSVAATALGGYYMYDRNRGVSYTLFFFSGLFYGGNIFSAYNSAEKRNYKTLQVRYESISSQYGPYNPKEYIDIERVFR